MLDYNAGFDCCRQGMHRLRIRLASARCIPSTEGRGSRRSLERAEPFGYKLWDADERMRRVNKLKSQGRECTHI